MRDLPPGACGRLLERARRLQTTEAPGTALSDLAAGHTDAEVVVRRGLPLPTVRGIHTFYDGLAPGPRACDGTACHFARAALGLPATPSGAVVRCLGMCYAGPTDTSDTWDVSLVSGGITSTDTVPATSTDTSDTSPDVSPGRSSKARIPCVSLVDTPVVLRNVLPGPGGTPPAAPMDEYRLPAAAEILPILEATGLRGRGGAAFPTAAKWRTARDTPAPDRFVVANGDEGDPGSFVDRLLLEEAPHAVLAGMYACARAIGASRGIVYIRGEYPTAQARIRAAIEDAPLHDFDVRVVSGAGSYVCGEETALLRSIEGLRGEPHPKPPYPAERGLHALPTVVQNVETLALVPWILRNRRAAGTKGVSVSGAVARPGLVEAALGTSIAEILHRGAGGPAPGRPWRMALVGGPMGRVVPVAAFHQPLSYEGLPGMGHAGIVVLDETVTPRALAEHLFAFAKAESCGNCTPCRVGSTQLAGRRTRPDLERLLDTLEVGSLCGFGQGAPRPIRDLLAAYGDAVLG